MTVRPQYVTQANLVGYAPCPSARNSQLMWMPYIVDVLTHSLEEWPNILDRARMN